MKEYFDGAQLDDAEPKKSESELDQNATQYIDKTVQMRKLPSGLQVRMENINVSSSRLNTDDKAETGNELP